MSETSLIPVAPVIVIPRRRNPHAEACEDALREALHEARSLGDFHLATAIRVAQRELTKAEERQRAERQRWGTTQ